ncbi:hypothetical protein EJB54_21680 [Klebsiella pneumoniae]|mgnify:CR=1 FL=1|nr:hypothetical protein EJB54_21680 [Klebsiella pneumoniae]
MLKPNHVYIEVSRNQTGGLSLCVSDDNGGFRISGAKVGGCKTLKCFEVDADELIKQINAYKKSKGESA